MNNDSKVDQNAVGRGAKRVLRRCRTGFELFLEEKRGIEKENQVASRLCSLESTSYFAAYWLGVRPVSFLKIRLNVALELNPQS